MFTNCKMCMHPLDVDDGDTVICPNCGTDNSRKLRRGLRRIDDSTSMFNGYYIDDNGDIWTDEEVEG